MIDSAGAVPSVHPVVALLAPPGAPRVLDDPEGQLGVQHGQGVDAVAYDEDAVVDAVFAAQEVPGVRDPSEVEHHGVGVDSH